MTPQISTKLKRKKMKTKIFIILLSSLALSCNTRKKALKITEFKTSEIEKIEKDSVSKIKKEELIKVADKIKVDNSKKEENTSVEIKGKTDSLNDFHYDYVSGTDTVQVSIKGKADFKIKSNIKKSEEKKSEEKESEKLNIIQEAARKTVSQSTINKITGETKSKDVDTESTGFTFGAWISWIIIFAIIISLTFLFYKSGGKIDFGAILRIFKKKD